MEKCLGCGKVCLGVDSGVTRFILQEGQQGGKSCSKGGNCFNDIISNDVII